jgi:hypothetical protein
VCRRGKVHKGFKVVKPEGKIPFGGTSCRWKDNIKMGIKEIGWEGVDWIDLAQDKDKWRPLVNTVMNFRTP